MKNEIADLKKIFLKELERVDSLRDFRVLEQSYLGRKSGSLSALMNRLTQFDTDERHSLGEMLNELKRFISASLSDKKEELARQEISAAVGQEEIDVTQPILPPLPKGHLHPVTQVQDELEDLFTSLGFTILDGPELESEYYNFESLNIPADHPARDMQDTFYIKDNPHLVMRTHTSPVQSRALEIYGVPLRVVAPGRCFRNESTDARHEHTFDQIEGFMVGQDINFSHLKGILETIARHLYGEDTRLRLRPKFYPFVEPGVNGEVTCSLCRGQGCRVCKWSGWLEIFGAGMVHPNVLRAAGIDSDKYQGFAFGLGLTRLVMLRYGIEDIRLLRSGDLRFLQQF